MLTSASFAKLVGGFGRKCIGTQWSPMAITHQALHLDSAANNAATTTGGTPAKSGTQGTSPFAIN